MTTTPAPASQVVNEENAVFITGLGRSGTTLLLKLFDGHPELLTIAFETLYFREILPVLESQGTEPALQRLAEVMAPAARMSGRPLDIAAFINRVRCETGGGELANRFLRGVVRAYGRQTNQVGRAAWIEKTPRNELFSEQMRRFFSNAKFIHIIRDPRGVYQSHLKARVYTPAPAQKIAQAWRAGYERWLKLGAAGNSSLVRYEALVSDTRTQMQDLAAFIGIHWDDALLSPTEHGVPWRGNSFTRAENDSHGVRTRGVSSWQNALTGEQVRVIEGICGDVMKKLGYELTA